MPSETTGLINSPNPKPPKPQHSPKSFMWLDPNRAREPEKQTFAAALQELLPEKEWTHTHLARELWGMDKRGNSHNIGKARDWVKGLGRFPTETEAGYIAQLLEVPMARLMAPKTKFDPNTTLIRPMRARKDWNTNGKGNGHASGHVPDTRWLRPEGVDPVFLKFESSKKHPTLVTLEVRGDMPAEVAMAIMSMVASKTASE